MKNDGGTQAVRQSPRTPPRTFGLSLAILVSVILFTVLPLLQVLLVVAIRSRLAAVVPGGSDDGAIAVGANFVGLTDSSLLLQIALGVGFAIIALLAWRGRPRGIRWVMIAAVLGITGTSALLALINLAAPAEVSVGIDSGRDLERGLLVARTSLSALVALYVLWYMNRAPARAFYRGYYLPAPDAE
ncbi:MAG: hypothetical protein SGJ24_06215 [Chloroflexota bacterium]|nr:hypothetical protein [Chloroflexota bacterium]